MTRINIGIPPADLLDKHLLAEHREIKRIPNAIKKNRVRLDDIPQFFTLGKGHVKFFYNKIGYLKKRYISIREECIARGFNVTNYENSFDNISQHLMNDYIPTSRDIGIIKERIRQKEELIINKRKTNADI